MRRHRLHRGGDRGVNHALHTIALCRMRYDQRTRAYLQRRVTEGLSKQEILPCLKRYIVRDVYTALPADFAALTLDLHRSIGMAGRLLSCDGLRHASRRA